MARKRYKPEEIVAKLRQVDVLVSQGQGMTEAIHLQPAKFLTPTIVGHLAHTDLPDRLDLKIRERRAAM